MPRKTNALKNTNTNVTLTPPMQVPTPLPDEEPHPTPLIDLDAPTPPQYPILLDDSYRSPPFREAQLPESPPPLPILPPRHAYYEDDDGPEYSLTTGSNVTYQGHTRVPTLVSQSTTSPIESLSRTIRGYGPNVPRAAPSPPLVSRPVGFGRFSSPAQPVARRPSAPPDFESEYASPTVPAFGLAQALLSSPANEEAVVWSGWDKLGSKTLLLVGYTTGFQIWDCSDLPNVTESFNIHFESQDWVYTPTARVVHAAVFPLPSGVDVFAAERPLLGILLETASESVLVIYSLSKHCPVKRLTFHGRSSLFIPGEHVLAISTTTPPELHIFSSSSFQRLHTLPASALELFAPLPPPPPDSVSNTLLTLARQQSIPPPLDTDPPHPVWALSHRLLAYASPSPVVPNPSPTSSSPAASASPSSSLGAFLGGIRNRVETAIARQTPTRLVSRSAPENHTEGYHSPSPQHNQVVHDTHGYYITVIDLLSGFKVVATFRVSRSQPIKALRFSSDGTSILVVPRDGHLVKVFKVLSGRHVYTLRRGITDVAIGGLDWTSDGRWVGVGTRNGTVHVFATNPYGGKPKGHREGGVRDDDVLQHPLTDLNPVARIRVPVTVGEVPVSFTFVSSLDILVFNPEGGVLTLRRLGLSERAVTSVPKLMTSVSFPGSGSLLFKEDTQPSEMELVAKESIVASWDLMRRMDWEEVKKVLQVQVQPHKRGHDWLSQAELSTFSKSLKILPRTIYLSHQFSFYTLGEDYHALIRRFQLDITGTSIQVRRQVQISPHTHRTSDDNFMMENLSSPLDIGRRAISSSFDEPLALAISGSFDHANVESVLPMYPNGVGTKVSRSFGIGIPIRHGIVEEGIEKGIEKLRGVRGLRRASAGATASASTAATATPEGGGGVALEFDEEDEDFLIGGMDVGDVEIEVVAEPVEEGEPEVEAFGEFLDGSSVFLEPRSGLDNNNKKKKNKKGSKRG